MAGRPTKLTPELQQALITAVAEGLPLSTACATVGVSHGAVLEWLARGEGRSGKAEAVMFAMKSGDRDRLRAGIAGTLLGLHAGDCLGATREFAAADPSRSHREITGGGPSRRP